MDRNTYISVTSVIFLAIGVGHLFRVINGWDVSVGTLMIPSWVSYAAIAVGGYLAWSGYNFRK